MDVIRVVALLAATSSLQVVTAFPPDLESRLMTEDPFDIVEAVRRTGMNVNSFDKSDVDLTLKQNIGLLFLRKVLRQGDILSERQMENLDSEIKDSKLTCDLCQVGVKAIQVLNSDAGRDLIGAIAVGVCMAAKIESDRVCKLAVNQFEDMIFYMVFNMKPEHLCYWLLKEKCTSKPEGYLPTWNITVPSPPTSDNFRFGEPLSGHPTSKFLFFTDMHMDTQYMAGASASCGEPLCCRDNNPTPSDPSKAAGRWGDYRNCDMPIWTVEGMMRNLSQYKFDFIIFTGDIPAHNVWNQTSLDQIDKIQRWTNHLTKYFPDTPVYAAVGNHESAPVNSYPPSSIYGVKGADIRWLYQTLYESWSHWIPSKDMETVLQGGFYTTLIQPGFRVVSLNTNLGSDDSWWQMVGNNSIDPQGQLKWFAQVMQKAEDMKERVLIITHRPIEGAMESWKWNYYNIMTRYQNNIIAHLLGHAHTDELRLYYDSTDPNKVASVGLVGPGYTTYSFLNAGYRVYTIDGNYPDSTHTLMEAESYYLNITDANLTNKPVWKFEYSTTKDYGMTSLSPAQWQKLVDRFEQDDDLFQHYHKYISKSEDTSRCDAGCKKSTICGIKQFRPGDKKMC